MDAFSKLSYRMLGPRLEKDTKTNRALQARLNKAHVPVRAAAYQAATLTAGAAAAVMGLAFGALLMAAVDWPERARLLILLIPLVGAIALGGGIVWLANWWLDLQASSKGTEIDENLPHGLNHMLALANAGLTPAQIWGSLARAQVFGALAFEAERIHRDLTVFGRDILTALRLAQERTPSARFQEFLQGAISAFQSGVELESYLKTKGAQFQREATEEMLEIVDTMGIMAEAFLVVVVAAPLFLIILLTVMAVNKGGDVIGWGFLLSLVVIPIAQMVLGGVIRSMNPRLWT